MLRQLFFFWALGATTIQGRQLFKGGNYYFLSFWVVYITWIVVTICRYVKVRKFQKNFYCLQILQISTIASIKWLNKKALFNMMKFFAYSTNFLRQKSVVKFLGIFEFLSIWRQGKILLRFPDLKRSIKFIMNLWGHRFSQNANQKFEGFLPYPLINFQGRNPSTFWLVFLEKQRPYRFILNLSNL